MEEKERMEQRTQILKRLLSLKQVIDNDRQLIAVEMKFPQVFQVFELLFIEIFKLQKWEKRKKKNKEERILDYIS